MTQTRRVKLSAVQRSELWNRCKAGQSRFGFSSGVRGAQSCRNFANRSNNRELNFQARSGSRKAGAIIAEHTTSAM